MIIKALSLHQPWASMIQQGSKNIETQTWWTDYWGRVLNMEKADRGWKGQKKET